MCMTGSILEASEGQVSESIVMSPAGRSDGPTLLPHQTVLPVQSWLQHLTLEHRALLHLLIPLAEAHGLQLYLVGGLVRDAFLGRPSPDLDLMLEAPSQVREAFVVAAAELLGGLATAHPRFLTWRIEGSGGAHLDLVTARRETYPQPGSLPVVVEAPALVDLLRRDFTVNSMAVPLTGPAAGRLLDPLHGRADLQAKRLRILHPDSFRDDPTRMFRALRFATRLGLALEPDTQRCLVEAVREGLLDRLTGERVQHELVLILEEDTCAKTVQLLVALEVWEGLKLPLPSAAGLMGLEAAPGVSRGAWQVLEEAHRKGPLATGVPALWLLRLGLLLQGAPGQRLEGVLERLSLTGRGAQHWKQALDALGGMAAWLAEGRLPSERTFRLEKCSSELLGLLLSQPEDRGGRRREQLERFLRVERQIRSPLDGRMLLGLGWSPGPGVREALTYLRVQALDAGWGEAEARGWAGSAAVLFSTDRSE